MPTGNTAALLPSVLCFANVLPEAALQSLHPSQLTAARLGHILADDAVSHACMAIQDYTVVHNYYTHDNHNVYIHDYDILT